MSTRYELYELHMKILDRYIATKVLSSFQLGLVVFMIILFLGSLLDFLKIVGGSPLLIFNFMVTIIIVAISMALPPAFLFGTLMAISQFSTDSELVAMEAIGISLKRIALPVTLLGFCVTFIALIMTLYITPVANQALQGTALRLFASNPQVGIREGEFIRLSRGLWFYCSTFRNNRVKDVLIYDERGEMTKIITATQGKFKVEPSLRGIILRMKKGEAFSSKGGEHHLLTFDKYEFLLSTLDHSLGERTKKDLTFTQLLKRLRREKSGKRSHYINTLTHLHKRFALPFSALVFGLLAISLGGFLPKTEKWTGLLIAFGLFLIYYVLLSISQNLVQQGIFHPFWGAWSPNIILGMVGCVLLWIKSEKVGF